MAERCDSSLNPNLWLSKPSPPAPFHADGIKRDSAYRLGFVVVEYRWHPLYGKKLRLLRRTAHGGAAVVHVEASGTVSRELPAWMVDGSACTGMELGPPQVSIAALNELRAVMAVKLKAADRTPGLIRVLGKGERIL